MDITLNRQKVIFILITAVLLFGLMVMAGSLAQVELSPGESFDWLSLLRGGSGLASTTAIPWHADGAALVVLFQILFWAGLAAAIIFAFISPEFRRQALAILMLVVIILLLGTLAEENVTGSQGVAGEGGLIEGDLPTLPPPPEPPTFVTDPPDWIIWVVAEVVALLFVAFAIYVWRQRRQTEPDPQQLFLQEAAQALQELDAGGDLRDVVMRCYAQMEGVMRHSQAIERQQSMTPREFEDHLLRAGFSDRHIGRLIRLFEEVRYGAQSSDKRAEREARACLSAIVASYG